MPPIVWMAKEAELVVSSISYNSRKKYTVQNTASPGSDEQIDTRISHEHGKDERAR